MTFMDYRDFDRTLDVSSFAHHSLQCLRFGDFYQFLVNLYFLIKQVIYFHQLTTKPRFIEILEFLAQSKLRSPQFKTDLSNYRRLSNEFSQFTALQT
jgi:hypothetical protein